MADRDDVFRRALKLDPVERDSFLLQFAPEVQFEVRKLLQADVLAERGFLESSFAELSERDPTHIGHFKILRRVGEGGMGRVFLGEQREPIARKVAIKVINTSIPTKEVLARFEAERRALAVMEHPNIAKVFEAGVSEYGSPYLVMEYVNGSSITDYSDAKRLTINERMTLFVQACKAIQHAHSRGVIHRDIKPSNVLVSEHDGTPVVKVIDFGLAKSLKQIGEESTRRAYRTSEGRLVGTWAYMSPEQSEGNAADIDIRTDVFSLGAVLYELLAGSTPIPKSVIKNESETAILTLIRNADFCSPSKRIEELRSDGGSVTWSRETATKKLKTALESELDWIVLKSLEKDRKRRYETAVEFSKDVERFLRNETVIARPRSVVYRLKKFTSRNKLSLGIAVACIVMLMMIGIVQSRMRTYSKAQEIVSSLCSARSEAILPLVKEIQESPRLTQPILESLLLKNADLDGQSRENVVIALASQNNKYSNELYELALVANVSKLPVYQRVFSLKHNQETVPHLWNLLEQTTAPSEARFNAALVLAATSSQSKRWTTGKLAWLVENILSKNPEIQPKLRELVFLLKQRLTPIVVDYVDKPELTQSQQVSAANFIADFAEEDQVALAKSILRANSDQFSILQDKLLSADNTRTAVEVFDTQLQTSPRDDESEVGRVRIGRRRANAAISSLLLGHIGGAIKCLTVDNDFESATQFVHLSRKQGISAQTAFDCFRACRAEAQKKGQGRQSDRLAYSSILLLGQFPPSDFDAYERIQSEIRNLYSQHPSAGVHSACGWLLKRWGLDKEKREVDEREFPYSPDREWFTIRVTPKKDALGNRISIEDGEIFLTMIVFPNGSFKMGSPESEVNRQGNETQINVSLSRPFALSDREVPWRAFNVFDASRNFNAINQQYKKTQSLDLSAHAITWDECIRFCHWIGVWSNVTDEEQALLNIEYAEAKDLEYDLSRTGFRLPTEAEWEYANRGELTTPYFFGSDRSLVSSYGWTANDSTTYSQIGGQLCPSSFGLFDSCGNLWEWCMDWEANPRIDGATDPLGTNAGINSKIAKGGAWNAGPTWCRTASTISENPVSWLNMMGFRLAMTLPSETDE